MRFFLIDRAKIFYHLVINHTFHEIIIGDANYNNYVKIGCPIMVSVVHSTLLRTKNQTPIDREIHQENFAFKFLFDLAELKMFRFFDSQQFHLYQDKRNLKKYCKYYIEQQNDEK